MKTDRNLKIASIIVTIIGLVDSIYLAWIKISNTEAICIIDSKGCEVVNNSRYSEIFGIPVALLGAGAYLAILIVLFLDSREGFWKDNGPMIIFGLSFAGVLYSAYLTYIELYVLHAICPFCVISAIALLILLILTIIRVNRLFKES